MSPPRPRGRPPLNRCPMCGTNFVSHALLQQHMLMMHRNPPGVQLHPVGQSSGQTVAQLLGQSAAQPVGQSAGQPVEQSTGQTMEPQIVPSSVVTVKRSLYPGPQAGIRRSKHDNASAPIDLDASPSRSPGRHDGEARLEDECQGGASDSAVSSSSAWSAAPAGRVSGLVTWSSSRPSSCSSWMR